MPIFPYVLFHILSRKHFPNALQTEITFLDIYRQTRDQENALGQSTAFLFHLFLFIYFYFY